MTSACSAHTPRLVMIFSRATGILGLLFLAYALATAHSLLDALSLASLALAFGFGLWLADARVVWLVVALALTIDLSYNTDQILLNGERTFGLWGNPNASGIMFALALAAALAFRWWLFLPIAIAGVALSQSRGALFAATVVALGWLWGRSRLLAILSLGCAIAFAWTISPDRASSIAARLGIWHDTIDHLTYFGAGWGTFFDAYRSWPSHINYTPLALPTHVYNDYLEVIYAFGLGAIPLWLFLAGCLDQPHEQRLIVLAFGAAALTFFPLSLFPHAQLFAMTLGQLYRRP